MDIQIFDNNLKSNEHSSKSFFWSSSTYDKKSFDNIVENKKVYLKSKFLNCINHITKNSIKNNKTLEFMGVNLFEMSLINEKNVYKSKKIYDCLKLLALEDLIEEKKISKIIYLGDNKELSLSLKQLTKHKNIIFKNNIYFSRIETPFVHLFRALFFYLNFIIRNYRKKSINTFKKDITFFSYFVHFSNLKTKEYNSFLWGGLNKMLKIKKIESNWFHFFVPSSQIKTIDEANFNIKNFNQSKYENHLILNSYLNIKEIIYLIFEYFFMFCKTLILCNLKKNFSIRKITDCSFYEILKKDVYSSSYGASLLYNMYNIKLLNKLLRDMPKQRLGFYLLENQSWENCLIKYWRKYNHGQLVGCINSTIRFWDLRYFKTKKEFFDKNNPDHYFFNSQTFKKIALKNFYPKKKCHVVEAVRYNHLMSLKTQKNKKILIIGDINLNENFRILEEFGKIHNKLSKYKVYFKPHPTNSTKKIKQLEKKYNKIMFLNNSKQNSFKDYEFIICSNGTSAIIDCIIIKAKYKIIKFNDLLNLNPLDNYPHNQLTNMSEIYDFINSKKKQKNYKNFLLLDKSLKKWKKFILFHDKN